MQGLRITVTDGFNNPLLNPSEVGSPLLLDTSVALYEMRSIYDRSPNGNHLILNEIIIDDLGLACDGIVGHNAMTGISEPSAFTILVAINVPAAPQKTAQIFSSLAEAASPLSGCRLAITTTGTLTASIGSSPSVTIKGCGGAIGGWTVFAISYSDDGIFCLRMNGDKYAAPVVGNRNYARRPMILGGGYVAPHDMGINGHIGLFCVYEGALSESEMMTLIQKGKDAMKKGKGINIG
ncbi:hypothetical protein [Serratia marcescens]|uniref:hypothetical protein n=1 Tax=Serratia marcescens TaxID=615 RepID=UPI00320A230C